MPFSPVPPTVAPDGELPDPPEDGFDGVADVGVEDSGSVSTPFGLGVPVEPDTFGIGLLAGVCWPVGWVDPGVVDNGVVGRVVGVVVVAVLGAAVISVLMSASAALAMVVGIG